MPTKKSTSRKSRKRPKKIVRLNPPGSKLLPGEPSFEERSRVIAGRGVPLEENKIGGAIAIGAAEKMILRNFVESGAGSEARRLVRFWFLAYHRYTSSG